MTKLAQLFELQKISRERKEKVFSSIFEMMDQIEEIDKSLIKVERAIEQAVAEREVSP